MADIYSQVADDLADWLDSSAKSMAAGMSDGSHAPFAANINEAQKLEYYRDKMFNPDGSPNVANRNHLLENAGAKNYAMVMNALGKPRAGAGDHPLQANMADQAIEEY